MRRPYESPADDERCEFYIKRHRRVKETTRCMKRRKLDSELCDLHFKSAQNEEKMAKEIVPRNFGVLPSTLTTGSTGLCLEYPIHNGALKLLLIHVIEFDAYEKLSKELWEVRNENRNLRIKMKSGEAINNIISSTKDTGANLPHNGTEILRLTEENKLLKMKCDDFENQYSREMDYSRDLRIENDKHRRSLAAAELTFHYLKVNFPQVALEIFRALERYNTTMDSHVTPREIK